MTSDSINPPHGFAITPVEWLLNNQVTICFNELLLEKCVKPPRFNHHEGLGSLGIFFFNSESHSWICFDSYSTGKCKNYSPRSHLWNMLFSYSLYSAPRNCVVGFTQCHSHHKFVQLDPTWLSIQVAFGTGGTTSGIHFKRLHFALRNSATIIRTTLKQKKKHTIHRFDR